MAETHVKDVSTREAEAAMRELSPREPVVGAARPRRPAPRRRARDPGRARPLGETRCLILDARHERRRHRGVVRDAAVLSAAGIGPHERRRGLGVSVAPSEAELHRRALPVSLPARGVRGVERVVRGDHAGRRAARRAVKVGAFPEASLGSLVGAVLVETHDRWAADTEAHRKRERQDARSADHRVLDQGLMPPTPDSRSGSPAPAVNPRPDDVMGPGRRGA